MKSIMVSMSALSPSQYRQYVKGWNKGRYAETFKEFAGKDAYRIYIPLSRLATDHVEAPDEIRLAVENLGWQVEDYRAGIAVANKGKRRMRIGRLLSKVPTLQKQFNEDKARAGYKGKFLVCISRHPYDIAGASTDRGWGSCMNLVDGSNRSYIANEVKLGSLVAYLIEETDTNIKHPTARTMIKPFYPAEDKSFSSKPVLIADREVYGTNVSGFVKTVQRWLDVNLNKHKTDGVYHIHEDSYDDGMNKHLVMDYDDPDTVSKILTLQILDTGYFKEYDADVRRLAFAAHPEFLSRFHHVKTVDVRVAGVTDPEFAYNFLSTQTQKVYEGNDSHRPIIKGDPDYRFECKQLLNLKPEMFERINKDINLTDEEVGQFVLMRSIPAISAIPSGRFNEGVMDFILRNVSHKIVEVILKALPDGMMPEEPLARLDKYPGMLMMEKQPTVEMLLTALRSKNNKNWYQVIGAVKTERMTVELVHALLQWLIDSGQDDSTFIRYAHIYLAESTSQSPARKNADLIEFVLKRVEHNGYDLRKFYTVAEMLDALPDSYRVKRYATGYYFNALAASFEDGSLELTDEDCLASIKADEGVDFLRASTDVLNALWDRPKALSFGISQLCDHTNYNWILEQSFCRIADKNLWSAFCNRDPIRAVVELRKLLSQSGTFSRLVSPYWLRENPVALMAYATIRPESIITEPWFASNPESLRLVLGDMREYTGEHKEAVVKYIESIETALAEKQ